MCVVIDGCLYPLVYRIALENSFRRWNETSNVHLQGVQSNGDIKLSFVSGNHGDGEDFDGRGKIKVIRHCKLSTKRTRNSDMI